MKIALQVSAAKSQDEFNSILEPTTTTTTTVFTFNLMLIILTQNSRFARLSLNQTEFCCLIVVFDAKVRDIIDKVVFKFIFGIVVAVYVDVVVQVLATSGCCSLTFNTKSPRCKSMISPSCSSFKQNKLSSQYLCI